MVCLNSSIVSLLQTEARQACLYIVMDYSLSEMLANYGSIFTW